MINNDGSKVFVLIDYMFDNNFLTEVSWEEVPFSNSQKGTNWSSGGPNNPP